MTMPAVVTVGRDHVGTIAESDGIRFYLTECCKASVTGVQLTAHNPHGVACRACYGPVDPRLSAAWLVQKITHPQEDA